MMTTKRRFLGRLSTAITRQRVYRVEDAIEVDEVDHFEVTRRRVFFDDVLLVTRHRYRGKTFLTLTGLMAFFGGGFAAWAGAASSELGVGVVIFALFGFPFLIAFLLRAMVPMEQITVFGRRSKATMRYWFRKKKGEEAFAEITAAVSSNHRRLAAQAAKEESAELPMPPAPPSEP